MRVCPRLQHDPNDEVLARVARAFAHPASVVFGTDGLQLLRLHSTGQCIVADDQAAEREFAARAYRRYGGPNMLPGKTLPNEMIEPHFAQAAKSNIPSNGRRLQPQA